MKCGWLRNATIHARSKLSCYVRVRDLIKWWKSIAWFVRKLKPWSLTQEMNLMDSATSIFPTLSGEKKLKLKRKRSHFHLPSVAQKRRMPKLPIIIGQKRSWLSPGYKTSCRVSFMIMDLLHSTCDPRVEFLRLRLNGCGLEGVARVS